MRAAAQAVALLLLVAILPLWLLTLAAMIPLLLGFVALAVVVSAGLDFGERLYRTGRKLWAA